LIANISTTNQDIQNWKDMKGRPAFNFGPLTRK